MAIAEIEQFKNQLISKGYTSKAVIPDAEFSRLLAGADRDKDVIETPSEELRYIEGLLELPLGHLKMFCVIPKDGDGLCLCGRKMSALDIVQYAVRHAVHSRTLIRDALIGMQNVFEIAQSGRQGECVNCGKPVHTRTYFGASYIYA